MLWPSNGLSASMCVRMWETLGWLWRVRMRDVRDEGLRDGSRARRRSGLSRMRRVFRGEVEVNKAMALDSVVRRETRSRDLRI